MPGTLEPTTSWLRGVCCTSVLLPLDHQTIEFLKHYSLLNENFTSKLVSAVAEGRGVVRNQKGTRNIKTPAPAGI